MSNILIIKHGSLGDIAQISGVLKDIREAHVNDKIFILTTFPYVELLSKCPFVDAMIIDKRLPRWNFLYLLKLKKKIASLDFSRVYDLQNSSRTSFYRKYLFNITNWSSSETSIDKKMSKNDFDKDSVLSRFKFQLNNSNIKTKFTPHPDFSWACADVNKIVNQFISKKFILIFPFSSPQLSHKQWPYYNELIKIIKSNYSNIEIVFAPGTNELKNLNKIDAIPITTYNKALNISELAGLIKKSSFIIANDTGPAHMAAHLGMNGIVLFGYHTSPSKVSIETDQFKALTVENLNNLSAEYVYSEIKNRLKLIFN